MRPSSTSTSTTARIGDEREGDVDAPCPSVVEALGRAVVVRRPCSEIVPPASSPPRRRSSVAASRQASRTAPPVIVVWREAEVEPAEPHAGVGRVDDDVLDAELGAGDLAAPW